METEAQNNMSADKIKKIDHEIDRLHIQIKETNAGLRNRMKDILKNLETWDGTQDEHGNGKGFMPGEQESRF